MRALKVNKLIDFLHRQDPEDYIAVSLDERLDKIALVQAENFAQSQVYLEYIKGVQHDYIEERVARKMCPRPVKVIIITGSITQLGESEKFDK
jgi:hypothetical protein